MLKFEMESSRNYAVLPHDRWYAKTSFFVDAGVVLRCYATRYTALPRAMIAQTPLTFWPGRGYNVPRSVVASGTRKLYLLEVADELTCFLPAP